MTEIEIRGKLTKEDFDKHFEMLYSKGELVDHYHRLSVDLSPGFDSINKTWKNSSGIDIRLKKSDDNEKISIKVGGFHDLERKEIEVKLQSGQLLLALDLFNMLGYREGMIYFWESWEFNYLGVEIKLSKHSEEYYTFEVEGKENSEVKEIADKLGLVVFTAEEYKKAIDWQNQNVEFVYDRETVEKILKLNF